MILMKAITPENLHHELTGNTRDLAPASGEKNQLKKPDASNEVETTVWVLMAILFALVILFGYLFWNKF